MSPHGGGSRDRPTTYGSSDFLLLADDFRDVPASMRAGVARRLRPIGESTVADARQRASWSSRIPGAISLRVQFTGKNPGLTITVDHTKAPHGRAFEGIVYDVFRHPLFGDRDHWYDQKARPYVWPAVQATQQEVADLAENVIDEVFSSLGFH